MLSLPTDVSRRHFLKSTGLASAALLAPSAIFAQNEVSAPGLVEKARNGAATATISVERLRGNVSVLFGAGGNIAVLPGRDGKLLVDAGFAGARPKITEALAGVSAHPVAYPEDPWQRDLCLSQSRQSSCPLPRLTRFS